MVKPRTIKNTAAKNVATNTVEYIKTNTTECGTGING